MRKTRLMRKRTSTRSSWMVMELVDRCPMRLKKYINTCTNPRNRQGKVFFGNDTSLDFSFTQAVQSPCTQIRKEPSRTYQRKHRAEPRWYQEKLVYYKMDVWNLVWGHVLIARCYSWWWSKERQVSMINIIIIISTRSKRTETLGSSWRRAKRRRVWQWRTY